MLINLRKAQERGRDHPLYVTLRKYENHLAQNDIPILIRHTSSLVILQCQKM
jgi:hypothetical protein